MELIYGNKFKELDGVCYMSWDELWANKPRPSSPYVLVTHEGDGEINHHFDYILQDPFLVRWYAINANIEHPKLTLIPCGIEYRIHDTYGKTGTDKKCMTDVFDEVARMAPEKNNDVYCNFAPHLWVEERQRCLKAMDRCGLAMAERRDYRDYLLELKGSRFAVCPIGNGIDTFRLWECLYLGVIPIMTETINGDRVRLANYDMSYYNELPILWIPSWEHLRAEDLTDELYRLMMDYHYDGKKDFRKYMDMGFWREKIKNKQK